jgi:hypothetical protein
MSAAKTSTKAMILRTMINPFGKINDIDALRDELIISVYSDVI